MSTSQQNKVKRFLGDEIEATLTKRQREGITFANDPSRYNPVLTSRDALDILSGVPVIETEILDAGRNARVTNSWLRTTNGVPLNISPFVVLFNSELIGLSISTETASNCTVEVHLNGDIISPPASINSVGSLVLSGATEGSISFLPTVAIPPNTKLGVFIRGVNVMKPNVLVYLRRLP